MINIKKIDSDDFVLSRQVDAIQEALNAIGRLNPILFGNIVTVPTIGTATAGTLVEHGLQRAYTGYIVIDNNVTGIVTTALTVNTRPQDQIFLRANIPMRDVKIYFF